MLRFDDPSTTEPATVPPPPAETSTARPVAYLSALLERHAAESSRQRGWSVALGLAKSAVALPIGIDILGQGHASGAVLVVSGVVDAGGSLLAWLVLDEPFAVLRRSFAARLVEGGDRTAAIAATEREWEVEAGAAHRARLRVGTLTLVAGTFLVGAGALVGLNGVAFPSKSSSANDRATVGVVAMGLGGLNLSMGARALLVAEPLESGWSDYQQARTLWERTTVGVAPALGGATIGLTSTF